MAKKILSPIEKANNLAKKEAKQRKAKSTLLILSSLLGTMGIPAPNTEFIFHPERKWRFDYCWPDKKIVLEVEGGTFGKKSRHTSGVGFREDIEKYNQAVLYGYRVVRTTPEDLMKIGTADLIRQLYNQ